MKTEEIKIFLPIKGKTLAEVEARLQGILSDCTELFDRQGISQWSIDSEEGMLIFKGVRTSEGQQEGSSFLRVFPLRGTMPLMELKSHIETIETEAANVGRDPSELKLEVREVSTQVFIFTFS